MILYLRFVGNSERFASLVMAKVEKEDMEGELVKYKMLYVNCI